MVPACRLGSGRILLDPGVRVTYGFSQKWLMYSDSFNEQALTGITVTSLSCCTGLPGLLGHCGCKVGGEQQPG